MLRRRNFLPEFLSYKLVVRGGFCCAGVTLGDAVVDLDGFVHCLELHHIEDGHEQLCASQLAACKRIKKTGSEVGEAVGRTRSLTSLGDGRGGEDFNDGGLDPVAGAVDALAASKDLAALLDNLLQSLSVLLDRGWGVQGAHQRVWLGQAREDF